MAKKIVFLDVESTGKEDHDRLCEIAYKLQGWDEVKSELYKPPVEICIEAMAVNHITNAMVKNKPKFYGSKTHKQFEEWFNSEASIMVAHNAQFDAKMLVKEGIKTPNIVCTMKVMRHLDMADKIPSYKLQYLRYFLGIDNDEAGRTQAHNAADDVIILERLFDYIQENEDISIPEMIKVTNEPFLLRKLTFGKHKGVPIEKVPRDYLIWLRRQPDLDEDLIFTLNHYINN